MTNKEKIARKELFAAYQRVFDTAGELQRQLNKNNQEMKSFKGTMPTDEFSVKRFKKEGENTLHKAENAFMAKKGAEVAQNKFNNVSDKTKKEGRILQFNRNESLLNVFEELEVLITEMINTGISGMMDAQPNPIVGASSMKRQKKGSQKRGQLGYKYIKIRKATMN